MEQSKICSHCGIEKPLSYFPPEKRSKDGKLSYCKTCRNLQGRKSYKNNIKHNRAYDKIRYDKKMKLFEELKTTSHCLCCDESDNDCLDFHHINPNEKDFCISRLFTGHYSLIRIKKELQKCICLCSNCHRKFHAKGWKYLNGMIIKELL